MDTFGAILRAIAFWFVIAIPILLTAGAFLDAARRPEWAWSLANRNRVVWMAVLLGGGITVVAGPPLALLYLLTARRDVANAERGEI